MPVSPMSWREFRRALKRLGLSQIQAANHLGVSPRTVRYWVAKDAEKRTPIPGPVVLVVRMWLGARRPKGAGA